MSSVSSFDIIDFVIFPDPKIFLCIPASAANAAAVNPKAINTLLANGLVTYFIKRNMFLATDLIIYPKIILIVSSLIIEFLII